MESSNLNPNPIELSRNNIPDSPLESINHQTTIKNQESVVRSMLSGTKNAFDQIVKGFWNAGNSSQLQETHPDLDFESNSTNPTDSDTNSDNSIKIKAKMNRHLLLTRNTDTINELDTISDNDSNNKLEFDVNENEPERNRPVTPPPKVTTIQKLQQYLSVVRGVADGTLPVDNKNNTLDPVTSLVSKRTGHQYTRGGKDRRRMAKRVGIAPKVTEIYRSNSKRDILRTSIDLNSDLISPESISDLKIRQSISKSNKTQDSDYDTETGNELNKNYTDNTDYSDNEEYISIKDKTSNRPNHNHREPDFAGHSHSSELGSDISHPTKHLSPIKETSESNLENPNNNIQYEDHTSQNIDTSNFAPKDSTERSDINSGHEIKNIASPNQYLRIKSKLANQKILWPLFLAQEINTNFDFEHLSPQGSPKISTSRNSLKSNSKGGLIPNSSTPQVYTTMTTTMSRDLAGAVKVAKNAFNSLKSEKGYSPPLNDSRPELNNKDYTQLYNNIHPSNTLNRSLRNGSLSKNKLVEKINRAYDTYSINTQSSVGNSCSNAAIWSMTFSHCGRYMASGGQGGILRVWKVRKFKNHLNTEMENGFDQE
ncbi:hypothetical protein BB559_007022, partial [Furculomyces boomerangus]